jgi:hypothetical protein
MDEGKMGVRRIAVGCTLRAKGMMEHSADETKSGANLERVDPENDPSRILGRLRNTRLGIMLVWSGTKDVTIAIRISHSS